MLGSFPISVLPLAVITQEDISIFPGDIDAVTELASAALFQDHAFASVGIASLSQIATVALVQDHYIVRGGDLQSLAQLTAQSIVQQHFFSSADIDAQAEVDLLSSLVEVYEDWTDDFVEAGVWAGEAGVTDNWTPEGGVTGSPLAGGTTLWSKETGL